VEDPDPPFAAGFGGALGEDFFSSLSAEQTNIAKTTHRLNNLNNLVE
jgi:hypothetical protein